MYHIVITKDGEQILSLETDKCSINEKRAVIPIYKMGEKAPAFIVPSNKVEFSISGSYKVDFEPSTGPGYYTNI